MEEQIVKFIKQNYNNANLKRDLSIYIAELCNINVIDKYILYFHLLKTCYRLMDKDQMYQMLRNLEIPWRYHYFNEDKNNEKLSIDTLNGLMIATLLDLPKLDH